MGAISANSNLSMGRLWYVALQKFTANRSESWLIMVSYFPNRRLRGRILLSYAAKEKYH